MVLNQILPMDSPSHCNKIQISQELQRGEGPSSSSIKIKTHANTRGFTFSPNEQEWVCFNKEGFYYCSSPALL